MTRRSTRRRLAAVSVVAAAGAAVSLVEGAAEAAPVPALAAGTRTIRLPSMTGPVSVEVPASTTTTSTSTTSTSSTSSTTSTSTTSTSTSTTSTTVPGSSTTSTSTTSTTVPRSTTTTVPKTTTTTTVPRSTTTTTVPKSTTTTTVPKTTTTTPTTEPKPTIHPVPGPTSTTTTTVPHKPKAKPGAHFKKAHQPAHRVTARSAPGRRSSTPTAPPAPVQAPALYQLPVPAALVAANPSWIDGPKKDRSKAAGPVPLPVPPGTTVRAVTAGRITRVRTPRATPADQDPTSTVTLLGNDGATYTYTGVVQPAVERGDKVAVGRILGAAGAHGISFDIAVPDLAHAVDAREALEAWSLDTTVDVRALPATTSPSAQPDGVTAGRAHVLVVSDAAAGRTAKDLAQHLTARRVKVSTLDLRAGATVPAHAAAIAKAAVVEPAERATHQHKAKPAVHADLVIIALGSTSTTEAQRLLHDLPAHQQVLWVAPPTEPTTPTLESAVQGRLSEDFAALAQAKLPTYRSLVSTHRNLRVETLPSELATLTTTKLGTPGSAWSDVGSSVVASLTATYATTAYRLPLTNPKVATVLAYAEAQIGKPYQWAGAGPYSFDCSGLVMRAFERVGIDFVHNAYAQYEATKAERVSPDDLQPGDLVFFGPTEAGIHHVGIYVGDGRMIDAPETGQDVQIESMAGFGFYAATDPLGTANSTLAVATTSGLSQDQSFAQDLVTAQWGASQWVYLDELWNRESGWNPSATNPTSGAFGIPQALPAKKMSSAGADWATDPFTQIMWGIDYILGRYGSPQAAWAHETAFGWY